MKRLCAGIAALIVTASPALALDADYKRGYEEGFRQGYSAAQQELRGRAENRYRDGGGSRRGIVVSRAWYGSGSRHCDLTGSMASGLNGRVNGQVPASNQLCGDPHPGERKSLVVEYFCGGNLKRAEANEHRTVYLDCSD